MKIGAVSYLNTKPLVYDFTERLPEAEVTFDLPSRLAMDLQRGLLDVALIPSIEFLRHAGYTIVSDACIGFHGPVLSVQLFAKTDLPAIKTLALDEGSRTSSALVQIMLHQLHGIRPELTTLPIGSGLQDANADAVLLIGDRAMRPPACEYRPIWDLGELWVQSFDCPFVFAVWAARRDLADRLGPERVNALATALSESRDAGQANLATIAAAEHAQVGLTQEQCVRYLRDNLYFSLHEREIQGLDLYRRKAIHMGLLENDTPIQIYDCEIA